MLSKLIFPRRLRERYRLKKDTTCHATGLTVQAIRNARKVDGFRLSFARTNEFVSAPVSTVSQSVL